MSMGTPSPPQPQNPTVTADTQAKYNIQAGEMSQAGSQTGQNTPWGSLSFSQSGTGPNGVPIYTASQTLDPSLKPILDQLRGGAQTQLGNIPTGTPASVLGGPTSGATNALMNAQLSYLNPFFTQQSEQLDAQLRNQGIAPSKEGASPAYDRAINNLRQSQGQTVAGAVGQFEPLAFQQAMQATYGLPSQLAQSFLQQATPGALTAGQYAQTPQLSIGAPDYTGAVNSAQQMQMQAYQQQVANQTAMMSGLFGLGGKVLSMGMMSDIAMKDNITPVGKLDNGLGLYRFTYKFSDIPFVGVLAQEVEQVVPEAVFRAYDGYLRVNYDMLGIPFQTYDEYLEDK